MFTNLDNLFAQTEKEINLTQELASAALALEVPTELDEIVQSTQLLLQYRLNCQDALYVLAQLDRQLLDILGIDARHSAGINFERMSYALGDVDLKQILNALSLLVQSLLKVAARYKNEKSHSFLENRARAPGVKRMIASLQQLNTKQEGVVNVLNKALTELSLIKYAAKGPIYDHIAALQGPISRFYQALQHGLAVSLQLYERCAKSHNLQNEIGLVLNKTNEVLKQLPLTLQAQPSSVGYFKDKTHDELEERAAAKRMRPFFSPFKQ